MSRFPASIEAADRAQVEVWAAIAQRHVEGGRQVIYSRDLADRLRRVLDDLSGGLKADLGEGMDRSARRWATRLSGRLERIAEALPAEPAGHARAAVAALAEVVALVDEEAGR